MIAYCETDFFFMKSVRANSFSLAVTGLHELTAIKKATLRLRFFRGI